MQRFSLLAFKLLCITSSLGGCAGIIQLPSDAPVEMITEHADFPNVSSGIPHGCYTKTYVPARYVINTRGKLIRRAKTHFEIVPGTEDKRWNHVRSPAIYIETRKLLEPDHFTLHEVACPAANAGILTQTASTE